MTTPIGNSTMGLRLAQAYGTAAPSPVTPAAATQSTQPGARVQLLRAADRVDIAARVGPPDPARKAAQLVAAVVPGRVDFTVGEGRGTGVIDSATTPARTAAAPSTSGGPLPFYRAPSDRNAAATAIMIGRTVDVAG